MEKRKTLLWLNLALALTIIAVDIAYILLGQAYTYKTTASVLFVVLGIVNFVFAFFMGKERSKLFKYFMLTALIFACLGDIVLIEHFIIGAVLFAIGHVFFFIAYSTLYKIKFRDVLISLAIFGVALIVILVPDIFSFGSMLPVVIVYAFIISFMLGKSISNLFANKYLGKDILIMLGSLLFFLSDLMLA